MCCSDGDTQWEGGLWNSGGSQQPGWSAASRRHSICCGQLLGCTLGCTPHAARLLPLVAGLCFQSQPPEPRGWPLEQPPCRLMWPLHSCPTKCQAPGCSGPQPPALWPGSSCGLTAQGLGLREMMVPRTQHRFRIGVSARDRGSGGTASASASTLSHWKALAVSSLAARTVSRRQYLTRLQQVCGQHRRMAVAVHCGLCTRPPLRSKGWGHMNSQVWPQAP